MGIDRIGSGVPPAAVPESGGAAGATPTGSPFSVEKTGAPSGSPQVASAAPATTALERLHAGEIDLGGYVDLKVNEATAHLSGLPPSQLESIRNGLRERLAGDPSLVDLLKSATGETLTPRDD